MKILFVVTSDVTVEAFVAPQVHVLQERGHQVRVLSGRDDHTLNGDAFSKGWHHYISCSRSLASVGDLAALVQIARHIRAFSPDLVVAATPKAGLLSVAVSRLLRPAVPRVHLLWGLRSQTMTGVSRRVVRMMEQLTMSLSSTVVANSDSLAQEVIVHRLVAAEKLTVLGQGSSHGVDLARFRPSDGRPTPRTSFTVGFVGRVSRDKGVPELIKAVDSIAADGQEIRLRIVGPVEDHNALVGADDLADVVVEGPSRVEADTYWGFDVLCLPSHREGFPNVCLEASACGVPIVVSDATGCRDAVVDGVTGVQFPVGDSAALASVLTKLATDPVGRRRLGEAGRRWVERSFEAGAVLHGYANFYEDLAVAARSSAVGKSA